MPRSAGPGCVAPNSPTFPCISPAKQGWFGVPHHLGGCGDLGKEGLGWGLCWQSRTWSVSLPGTQRHAADAGGEADRFWDPTGQPGLQAPGEPGAGPGVGAGPRGTRGGAHMTPGSTHGCWLCSGAPGAGSRAVPASYHQHPTPRKVISIFFLRLVVLFESFNGVSRVVAALRGGCALP